ncbi:MAG: cell division protein FtsQ [Rhodobacteraceae bacterium]|nr:cell division protein FtsQ [Paracoccaceae bacterium]
MSAIERKDPAPSRIKYRIERLWLTPVYRAMIRTGLPIAIGLAVLANYLKEPETQAKLAASVQNAWVRFEERPEFAVKLMHIQGATDDVAQQVREAVPMAFPVSSMRLDLSGLKQRIEAVDAVRDAALFLRNGVLDIEIEERLPKLIWRNGEQLELIDGSGVKAGQVDKRMTRADLPLIVGKGAPDHTSEALRILAVTGQIGERVRGLRRVGERRWDVVLDRDQTIMLPVENPVQALERVLALHRARDLLGRDVLVVDVRDGRRPILRMTAAAVDELHRLRAIADGEDT